MNWIYTWLKKKWVVYPAVGFIVFMGVACFIGEVDSDGFWARFKTGIEPTFNLFAVIGGIYGLWLATDRGKIAAYSNHAQRYEKASEMLWDREVAGMREAGCYAMKSVGMEDMNMAIQCRELLVSFIQRSASTTDQEGLSRSDIIAADYALSSLYLRWCGSKKFRSFPLKDLPTWFWGALLTGKEEKAREYPGANLSGAALRMIKFNRANFSNADFSGANLIDVQFLWADLTDADLSGANLTGAVAFWADLTDADLSGANLTGAVAFGADLKKANLSGANLSKTNFKGDGSKEQEAKNLTKEQIESGFWDRKLDHPELPDYLEGKVDFDKMGKPPPTS